MTEVLLGAGIGAALLIGAGAIVLRVLLVVVTVRGRSMEPTLRNGDRVLVRRISLNQVRRGQLVVFRLPERARGPAGTSPAGPPPRPVRRGRSLDDQFLVKRAVAVSGDAVPTDRHPALARRAEERVPAESLVVVGDNTAASFDSRDFGYVTPDLVLGIVVRAARGPAVRRV
jgi:signal peptidase I